MNANYQMNANFTFETLIVFFENTQKIHKILYLFKKYSKFLILQYGCQMNANYTYTLMTLIVIFENTQKIHKLLYLFLK